MHQYGWPWLGPNALLDKRLMGEYRSAVNPVEKQAILEQIVEVRSRAWKEPLHEGDAGWARWYRDQARLNAGHFLRELAGRWAYEGYVESSGGIFDGYAAPPIPPSEGPWYEFGARIRKAPAEEGEDETLCAALAAFGAASGQPAPPRSKHWLAAFRAVRKRILQNRKRTPNETPNTFDVS